MVMDHLAALRVFVAVVERGAFARAAREMGQAPSSLTRQVDALEAHLGVALLNRSTRKLTLSDAGALYYEHASRILGDLAKADQEIIDRAGPIRGVLRVSLPVAFAQLHVFPLIPGFMREHPGIELEISLTDTPIDLVEERVDVAVRIGPVDVSSVLSRRLAGNARTLCASPAYLDARSSPMEPEDLADHACLSFLYGAGDKVWHFARGGERRTIAVSGPLRANSALMLRDVAAAGMGVALLAKWLIGPELAAGTLVSLLADWEPSPSGASGAIQAIYLPSRRDSRAVQAFVNHLAVGLRLTLA